MAKHYDFGKKAEEKATEYLEQNGYLILERNWRFQKAEIDIIAMDRSANQIVIAEVKARKLDSLTEPEDAVNKKKRSLLIMAADQYVVTRNIKNEARFDIISIHKSKEEWLIEHIKDAFYSFD